MGRKNFDPDKKHAAETMQQYEDVVSRRIRQLADETGCPADQLPPGLLLQDFENRSKGWGQASIRYHRSALVYWINRHVKDESQKDVLLHALLRTRRRLLSKQTDRRPKKAAAGFRDDDWTSITAYVRNLDSGSWAYAAGMLMEAILHTGLKPAEWKNARFMWLTAMDIQAMGFPLDALKQAIGAANPEEARPCLHLTKSIIKNNQETQTIQLVPVPDEAQAAAEYVTRHIESAIEGGKSFGIWQKEVQRGCRALMQAVFPTRRKHYTLLTAVAQHKKNRNLPKLILLP